MAELFGLSVPFGQRRSGELDVTEVQIDNNVSPAEISAALFFQLWPMDGYGLAQSWMG